MVFNKVLLAMHCTMGLTLANITLAQSSLKYFVSARNGVEVEVGVGPITWNDSVAAQNSPKDFVAAHNAARAEVGIGPITWNNTVAAYAQDYANQRIEDCALEHSRGPYGENIAMGYGDFDAGQAVKLWVEEKRNYDYASNSCAGDECLHYTQVVWRNSVHIGCARVQCKNGWAFITCNYYPPGNYVGERPY